MVSFGAQHIKRIAKKALPGYNLDGRTMKSILGMVTRKLKADKEVRDKVSDTIKNVAKIAKVSLTKNGKKRTVMQVWKDLETKAVVDLGKVTRRRVSSFGWWDNTQKNYCNGGQCSYTNELDSGYPYYGDWR